MEESGKSGRGLILQSMAAALGLAGLKLAAVVVSGSVGVLASALDSLMDFFTSALNYLSLRVSERPADREHPYGYGKIEALAGAVQGLLILAGGLAVLAESLRRVVRGARLEVGWPVLAVMAVSTLVSAVQGRRLARAAAERDSTVLRAEGLHFSMDVASNLGVLAVLGLLRLGVSPILDAAISAAISGYIVRASFGLAWSSIGELLDQRLSEDVHAEIEAIIRGHHPAVTGFHDLRTRRSGGRRFIDFHIEIAGVKGFEQAHELTESLIDRIKARMPNADVTVHYDPEGGR